MSHAYPDRVAYPPQQPSSVSAYPPPHDLQRPPSHSWDVQPSSSFGGYGYSSTYGPGSGPGGGYPTDPALSYGPPSALLPSWYPSSASSSSSSSSFLPTSPYAAPTGPMPTSTIEQQLRELSMLHSPPASTPFQTSLASPSPSPVLPSSSSEYASSYASAPSSSSTTIAWGPSPAAVVRSSGTTEAVGRHDLGLTKPAITTNASDRGGGGEDAEEDAEGGAAQDEAPDRYLDHYGQDLRRVPRWRLVEMLRLSQKQCEELEDEVQQLQARVDAQLEANRREQEEQQKKVKTKMNVIAKNGHDDYEQREESADRGQSDDSYGVDDRQWLDEDFYKLHLPSGNTVDIASLEGVQTLVRELSEEGGEMCAGVIASDGFRAVEFLAKQLGFLHASRTQTDEEIEKEKPLRDLQVESIRAMMLVSEKYPEVLTVLAQSMSKWLTPDLEIRDDPERLFYDLTILSKICSQATTLSPYAKAQLNQQMLDQIIDIISWETDDLEPHFLKAIRDAALLTLVSINLQFDSAESKSNPVIARLAAINGQDLGDLGQKFIIAFNREMREAIPPLVKLLRDLFSNPVTAKDFFFPNDLKVLVEIIMREVTDTSDTKLAELYLEVLHYLLMNSEYPKHIHRRSELSAFLLGLIRLEDDQTLGPLALKASAIFEEVACLRE